MIGIEDSPYTYDYKDHYKILPMLHNLYKDETRIKTGIAVPEEFYYSSETNERWMKVETLREWVINYKKLMNNK